MEEERWVPKHNPWLIAIVVSMATFMEVLDTSVANVALPHIAGSLGAGQDESTWVLTSYLVSNAVVLPIASYISTLIGRKRFYMSCVALFGISSLLCGLAPTLPLLLFFRVLQGAGGGGLGPSEQSILADTFAPEKRGQAFALYGMTVILAPTIGPTVGGWITDSFDWRWIFFINLPVVALSLFLTHKLVEDPPAIQKEVKEAKKGNFRIDYIGFGLLALTFGTLEVVLDKGQQDDWFGSSFIATFAAIAVVSFLAVVLWELWMAKKKQRPILDLNLFRNRTFTVAMTMMFVVGATLYAINTLVTQLLQNLMGYTAQQSGEAQIWGGVATMFCMALVGVISAKVDARKMIAFGFAVTAASLFYMAGLDLLMSFGHASLIKLYQGFGIAFLFIPISTMSYVGVSADQSNDVSGMTNLARNIGGSCGTAFLTSVYARHQQVYQHALVRNATTAAGERVVVHRRHQVLCVCLTGDDSACPADEEEQQHRSRHALSRKAWRSIPMISKYSTRSMIRHGMVFGLVLLWGALAKGQGGASNSQAPKAQQVQLSGRSQGGANVTVQQSATGSTASSVNTLNPTIQVQGNYGGSIDAKLAGDGPVDLTFERALKLGLSYNLGGVVSDASARQLKAQRLSALSALLPNIYATLAENAAKTDLQTQGLSSSTFGGGVSLPTVVGPYHYYSLQGNLSEQLSLTDIHNLRSADAVHEAALLSMRDARELIVVAVGGSYLRVLATAALVESQEVQVKYAEASYQQTADEAKAGTKAPIDANRSLVELQTERQCLSSQRSDLIKQKIQLARIIGINTGRELRLEEKLSTERPVAAEAEVSTRSAIDHRADSEGCRSAGEGR